MRSIDHIHIGQYLVQRYLSDRPKISQKAFVLGNVLPDINVFTYFRGFCKSRELKGHNYGNARKAIEKLELKLSAKKSFTLYDHLRLGKLIHYTADSFTYPHNDDFPGDLKAHVEYEEKLHQYFCERMKKNHSAAYGYYLDGQSFYYKLVRLHNVYENINACCERDVMFILNAVRLAMDKFIISKNINQNFKSWRAVS